MNLVTRVHGGAGYANAIHGARGDIRDTWKTGRGS